MIQKLILSKLLLLAFALFAANISAQIVAPTTEIATKVDEYMAARADVRGFGGSVLVAKDGRTVVAKGYGIADFENNTPITPDTKFRIGSITKQFTAASILLLQEKNKLSVQDSICKYLESCPEAWRPVTIHNLATMTSGIPSFTNVPDFRNLRFKDMTPAESVALVKDKPLNAKPGEKFEYSNTNYVLLGIVIEKVSSKSYEKFLTDNIVKPLNLKDTGYDHGKQSLSRAALGYTIRDEKLAPADKISMMVPYAAGGMYSTTGDLYKWQAALFRGRVFKKKETLDAMLTPNKGNYAYGLRVVNEDSGRKRIAHGGGIEGFVSEAAYFPDEKVFIVVLINNDNGGATNAIRDLNAIYFGRPYSVPKKRVAIKVDAALLDTYVGEYKLGEGMIFKIERSEDGLTFEPTGQRKIPLFAETDTFFFLTVVDATVKFLKDETGNVTALEFSQSGRTSEAKRIGSN